MPDNKVGREKMQQLISNSEMKYPSSLKMLVVLMAISPIIVAFVFIVVNDSNIFEYIVTGFALGLLFLWMGMTTYYCPKQITVTDFYLDVQLYNDKTRRSYTKEIVGLTETANWTILYIGKTKFFSKQYILSSKAGAEILTILNDLKHKFKHIPLKE